MNKAQAFGLSSAGIAGLLEAIEKEKERDKEAVQDGELIFWLTISGEANEANLSGLVSPDSLAQLIFFTLEHRIKITSAVNREKSAKLRSEAASAKKKKVIDWCNANPECAQRALKISVPSAMEATGISASSTVRDHISEWRHSRNGN
jgi:hypothetical protein